ncbi:MAG: hypothetical protein VXW65_07730 [Pseudomonadota bacterium]|nr:hypothetical protein [Pseudomonadota bacterium]
MNPDPDLASQPNAQAANPTLRRNLVPLPITVGLAVFVLVFSLGGFVPLPPEDRPLSLIALVLLVHLVIVPLLFLLGAWALNTFKGERVHWRNALSLGWLIAGVWILWKMGAGT